MHMCKDIPNLPHSQNHNTVFKYANSCTMDRNTEAKDVFFVKFIGMLVPTIFCIGFSLLML